jgi:hypothetical protein
LETFAKGLKALEAKAARDNLILTEDKLRALGKAREKKRSHGEIESHHPGYLGAQDTYYVGTIKGVGRIYQQTFIDTYAKTAVCKLYDRKNVLVAAEILNDRVLPLFEDHDVPILRMLTERGTELCGSPERYPYDLFLQHREIEHSKIKDERTHQGKRCEGKTPMQTFLGGLELVNQKNLDTNITRRFDTCQV